MKPSEQPRAKGEISAFDAAIVQIVEARRKWAVQAGVEPSSDEVEKSLSISYWAMSQEGDDLANCIREVIRFLNPPHQSFLDTMLWECFHRLSKTKPRKNKASKWLEPILASLRPPPSALRS